jgi:hypothetical protein
VQLDSTCAQPHHALLHLLHVGVGDGLEADGEGRLAAGTAVASPGSEAAAKAALQQALVEVRLGAREKKVGGDGEREVVELGVAVQVVVESKGSRPVFSRNIYKG